MDRFSTQAPMDTLEDFVGECRGDIFEGWCWFSWVNLGVILLIGLALFLIALKLKKK